MRNILAFLALILASTFSASLAWSASVTIGASKDNSIYQSNVNRSAGGAAGIFVGTTGSGSVRRGLIAFDVATNVPAGATITAAQLTLYCGASGGGADQSAELHRLNVDWGEGTAGNTNPTIAHAGVGYSAAAGDATWSANFFGTSLWSNLGATGDFKATSSASTVVPNLIETPYTWLSTPAMVSDIQSWLDNPATNFGWALINADEVNDATVRAFYSRSATVNAGGDPFPFDFMPWPALTITFTAVPEPAAAVLFLLAGPLIILGWRRRVACLRRPAE